MADTILPKNCQKDLQDRKERSDRQGRSWKRLDAVDSLDQKIRYPVWKGDADCGYRKGMIPGLV
jgi:hypothetical protein